MAEDEDQVDAAPQRRRLAPGAREVFLNVADEYLARMLRTSLDECAWLLADQPSESAVLVTDDAARDISVVRAGMLEVVPPRPWCAHRAIANVTSSLSQGVVLSDDPRSLADALAKRSSKELYISERAVELKHQLPPLTARQEGLLILIVRGTSTKAIVRDLKLSLSSVKREIELLEGLLGVKGRSSLAVAAVRLGFPVGP